MTSDTSVTHPSEYQGILRSTSLILAAFALGYAAASLQGKPNIAEEIVQPIGPTAHEDWHGNVMRSTSSY